MVILPVRVLALIRRPWHSLKALIRRILQRSMQPGLTPLQADLGFLSHRFQELADRQDLLESLSCDASALQHRLARLEDRVEALLEEVEASQTQDPRS